MRTCNAVKCSAAAARLGVTATKTWLCGAVWLSTGRADALTIAQPRTSRLDHYVASKSQYTSHSFKYFDPRPYWYLVDCVDGI